MSLSIHNAARNNQLSLVKVLVEENGDQVHAIDEDGRTPLHSAASCGADAIEVVAFLLEHGSKVDPSDPSGWTPLLCAASAGNEKVVRELLGAGADVNARNDKGMAALHYAASKGHIEIGRILLSREADNNARSKANQLPLHRAATVGSVGFVNLLLHPPQGSAKPRLNTADRVGNTPLHLAMESAHAEVAVLLINAGARRDDVNVDQEMPEQLEGVGGQEQNRARQYVIERCGPAPSF